MCNKVIILIDTITGEQIGQFKYDIEDNIALLHSVFIYPEYRNKGICSNTFKTIISLLKNEGISKIQLNANDETKIIWSKMGFIEENKLMIKELRLNK